MKRAARPGRPEWCTRWQWYWYLFIGYTGLRHLLFWLNASVPGFRRRLDRVCQLPPPPPGSPHVKRAKKV